MNRWSQIFRWSNIAFSVIGAGLAVGMLVLLIQLVNSFREELRDHVASMNDPGRLASFENALVQEQWTTSIILTLVTLMAAGTIVLAADASTGMETRSRRRLESRAAFRNHRMA
jgi:MFS superfamily sulfate permease-like transporter